MNITNANLLFMLSLLFFFKVRFKTLLNEIAIPFTPMQVVVGCLRIFQSIVVLLGEKTFY